MGRLKKDGTQAKESILRYEDAQYLASKAKPSGVNFNNADAFSRIETAGKSIAKLQKLGNDAKYQQEVDENQQVLFILGDAIQQLAEQGVDKVELASFIKSFTNTGHNVTNFFRKAPRLTGWVEGVDKAAKRIPSTIHQLDISLNSYSKELQQATGIKQLKMLSRISLTIIWYHHHSTQALKGKELRL